jgi:hypothetical protein
VSFQQGALRWSSPEDATLRLSIASGITHLPEERINVRAIALPLSTYYRLDGVVSLQKPLTWPISAVVRPSKLTDKQLGIFGFIGNDDERLFVPLRMVQGEDHGAREPTVLKVRPGHNSDIIVWRSYAEGIRSGGPPPWVEAAKSISAGSIVTIELPNGPEGILTVEVNAKHAGSDRWSPLKIHVFRPARQ